MVMKINGEITHAEVIQRSEEDQMKIEIAELQAENNSLRKRLMDLRRLAQTVSDQPPGGT